MVLMMKNASHTVCEVGRMYLVPCMFVPAVARADWVPHDGWVPVLGPRHNDAEHLEFPHEHYHIDWRFVPNKNYTAVITNWHGTPLNNVLSNTNANRWQEARLDGAPQLKRRLCRRSMPEFPSLAQPAAKHASRSRWQSLERAHACSRPKPGNICPHRGIDLTPFAKPDGTAICPGHGLKWNLHTGELLSHHETAK